MIEQSVSLASNGTAKLPGYEHLVRFGYTKNRGVYRLHVDATGEWEGLAIRCFWHVPDGKDPSSSLVVDGYVDVPASVTAQPGSGCITFEGSDDTKNITSADLHYRVSANSGTEDGTEPEPGTPAWQQLVDAVHTDATAAEQAKTDAQTAAQQAGASAQKAGNALSDTITAKEDALKATKDAQTAANEATTSAGSADKSAQEAAGSLQELKNGIASGEFKGEKGDPGPAVALDTTLTHEGEAADAKATGDAISAVKVRQNVLAGTETGNPIAVDDAFPAPLCGLTVYGRSTQSGTPTPDAPVPIVSAGESGSVAVTLSDGNGKTQTLTLPTPNGLPGIPVTSGGNYTDPQGQQWVCDEVDLERGVRVQRVYKGRVNTSDGSVNEQYRLALDIPEKEGKEGSSPCFISITLFTSWTSCVAGSKLYLKNIAKSEGSFYTAEELKALAIDVDFVYQLATPIETPLTPDEIAAYKALTAYGPDTVVQAGDGAGIRLEYQRDVNIAIKRIEDAIASMTTT